MRVFQGYGMRIEKWKVVLWTTGFMLLAALPAWTETELTSSGSSLSASVEKSTAKVGDLLWLSLTYDLPEGGLLPKDPAVGGIEKLNIVERVVRPGKIKFRFIVDQLKSFETEPVSLIYFDKNGNEQQIKTSPVSITVLSNLGEKQEVAALMPIQDIIPAASRWIPLLLWLTVAGVLLCFAIVWLWWRGKHRSGRIRITTVDPPHVRAEKEIDQLVAGGLFEKGDVKTFYFNFSGIIRRYMESIRHFPAVKMTTEEITRHVGNNSKDQEILQQLRQADLVKFADTVPTHDRKVQDIQAARTYIRQTGPSSTQASDIQHKPEAGA